MLTPVGRGDERPVPARTREHDVPRLIADQQRASHDRHRARKIDDTDAVGEMVHDPDFVVVPSSHRDGFHAHWHRNREGQPACADVENFERIVRGIDRK